MMCKKIVRKWNQSSPIRVWRSISKCKDRRSLLSLQPWAFDFSESAKFGAIGRFPTNVQVRSHFGSFLQGLESHREAMDVKFMKAQESSGVFLIDPFTVGFVDGQCKALIIQSILAMVSMLDFQLQFIF